MAKSWIAALLTLPLALGLIGLLACTSVSVPGRGEREVGPTLHRTGLMLTP